MSWQSYRQAVDVLRQVDGAADRARERAGRRCDEALANLPDEDQLRREAADWHERLQQALERAERADRPRTPPVSAAAGETEPVAAGTAAPELRPDPVTAVPVARQDLPGQSARGRAAGGQDDWTRFTRRADEAVRRLDRAAADLALPSSTASPALDGPAPGSG